MIKVPFKTNLVEKLKKEYMQSLKIISNLLYETEMTEKNIENSDKRSELLQIAKEKDDSIRELIVKLRNLQMDLSAFSE